MFLQSLESTGSIIILVLCTVFAAFVAVAFLWGILFLISHAVKTAGHIWNSLPGAFGTRHVPGPPGPKGERGQAGRDGTDGSSVSRFEVRNMVSEELREKYRATMENTVKREVTSQGRELERTLERKIERLMESKLEQLAGVKVERAVADLLKHRVEAFSPSSIAKGDVQ